MHKEQHDARRIPKITIDCVTTRPFLTGINQVFDPAQTACCVRPNGRVRRRVDYS
jgi:hypothetical protein